jgi:HSP20 family protein
MNCGGRYSMTGATMEGEAATAQLRANFYENVGGDEYVIEVPVPGMEQSEIVIEADPESLVVRTQPRERGETEARYIQREHTLEPMSRVFEFPQEMDTDNIRATLDQGILRIRIPKAAVGRRRVIRIAQAE